MQARFSALMVFAGARAACNGSLLFVVCSRAVWQPLLNSPPASPLAFPPAAAAPQQDRVSSAHAFMLNVFVPLPLHCPQPQHPDWTVVIVYPLLMHCGL